MFQAFIPPSKFAITPDNNRLLNPIAFGIECTGAGDVVYEDMAGNIWKDTVVAGGMIICMVRKVYATNGAGNTTATGIRGFNREQ